MLKGYHYEGPLPLGSVVAHNCGAAGLFSSTADSNVVLTGILNKGVNTLQVNFNVTVAYDAIDDVLRNHSWMATLVSVNDTGVYTITGEDTSSGRRIIGQILLALLRSSQGLPAYTEWGALVGVRPTKLFHKLMDQQSEVHASYVVKDLLEGEYFLDSDKAELLRRIGSFQRPYVEANRYDKKQVSLYCGIPFCQTHCMYCSFPYGLWQNYDQQKSFIQALMKDIDHAHHMMDAYGLHGASLYMGGGTPTILGDDDFRTVLERLRLLIFDGTEFTVEAGRPDSVSVDKIQTMERCGVNRISINPQTMQDSILKAIGRGHSVDDIDELFQYVRRHTSLSINMDFIAGLPGQQLSHMIENMDYICTNMPENVTIHTLALKKGSPLYEGTHIDSIPNEEVVRHMVIYCQERLEALGYVPYYLYRQQYMTGQLENIGYTLQGKTCDYNIHIMEERQSILSMGPGSSSKWISPSDYRQKKQHMPKNVDTYIESINQLLNKRSFLCKSFWEVK